MSADPDILCRDAQAPQEPAVKPETVEPAEPPASNAKLFVGIVLFALAAGVAITFLVMRGGGAASTSVEAATSSGEKPSETVATATTPDETPAECAGETVAVQHQWYCSHFLPFAKKASADHDRLDRLEAAGRDSSGPDVPITLWAIVIAIGLLTVFNTVRISKRGKPPAG